MRYPEVLKMFVPSDYMVLQHAEQRSRELSQRAERAQMLRQACVDRRGWFELALCKLVSAVGCQLVALGRRMERVDRPSMAAPRASSA